MKRKIVILIMGKSGCGKSTLERNLISYWPERFKKVVSSTTRPKRPKEKHGIDYWFITDEEYKNTDFIQVTEFANYRYGSAVSEYTTPQRHPILCVVPSSGADFTKTLTERFQGWGTYNIYFNIDDDRLIANMSNRGDSVEEITARLKQDDLDKQFQDSGLVPNFIVGSDDLDDQLHTRVYNSIFLHNISRDIHETAKIPQR